MLLHSMIHSTSSFSSSFVIYVQGPLPGFIKLSLILYRIVVLGIPYLRATHLRPAPFLASKTAAFKSSSEYFFLESVSRFTRIRLQFQNKREWGVRIQIDFVDLECTYIIKSTMSVVDSKKGFIARYLSIKKNKIHKDT